MCMEAREVANEFSGGLVCLPGTDSGTPRKKEKKMKLDLLYGVGKLTTGEYIWVQCIRHMTPV